MPEEKPKREFKYFKPDQIHCIHDCGFWVPGDGIFGKIPQESLHRLVEHHRAGCTSTKPEGSMADRFQAFFSQVTAPPEA